MTRRNIQNCWVFGLYPLSKKPSNSECHTTSSELFRICLEDGHNLYCCWNVTTSRLAMNKQDVTCSARGVDERFIHGFYLESLKGRSNLRDLSLSGRTILNWTLKTLARRCRQDSHGSEYNPVTASSQLDNESCDFMKGEEFLEQFHYYQRRKENYDQ
jgi:hypothetical protein